MADFKALVDALEVAVRAEFQKIPPGEPLPDTVESARQELEAALLQQGKDARWPGGVSDGLTLPCRRCGAVPQFDYIVDSELWGAVVPTAWHLDVVCLPCLDVMAAEKGLDVAAALRRVQFCGIGKTVLLGPAYTHYYQPTSAQIQERKHGLPVTA